MLILEKEYNLRTFDFNMNDDFTIFGCLNYFQDIARVHATNLNLGYDEALKKNMYWVLMKTKLEFYDPVIPEGKIHLITWPSAKSRIDFTRDYEILSMDKKLLVKGASQWVVIDKDSKKIVRSDNVDFPAFERKENYMREKFEKISVLDLSQYDSEYQYTIVNFDMDHNQHVNNASYARILFDGLDLKYYRNIRTFEINYLHEVVLGKKIEIYYHFSEKEILGLIVSENIHRVSFKITYK